VEVQGPVYFRISRIAIPTVFNEGHRFEWGKGVLIREGQDVTLFGTGIMSHFCLQAAELLTAEGVNAEVVHLASIKPIDRELILESVARTGCAVTAENATINGGFGSAVMEVIGEENPVPARRIGVRDRWVDSGGIKELFTHHGMQPEDIAEAAKQVIEKKKKE
jgi:transketolase